jgi:hypothetical protein
MAYPLPSMKDLANRVLRECGRPVKTTFVATTDPQAIMAYDGVLDGYADIWFRNRWEWQRYEASVPMVAGSDEYPLPANFQRMAVAPWFGPLRSPGQLTELAPETFYKMIAPMDPTVQGSPQFYTIDHTTLKLYPAPSSNSVISQPILTFQYWMELPARKTLAQESQPLNYMPSTFEEVLIAYAKAKLKQYLEFPDWDADKKDYERKLLTMIQRDRQVRVAPTLRTPFERVSEW